LQLFQNWRGFAFVVWVIRGLSKKRHVAIRPVDLIQIDVVGLQAFEAAVNGLLDVFSVDSGAVTHPSKSTRWPSDFAGDNEFVTLLVFEPSAYVFFSAKTGFCFGRHRIHLGGVYEIDTLRCSVIQLARSIGNGVLFAEGHRSEAEFGNL
jgi:hypothetical protein